MTTDRPAILRPNRDHMLAHVTAIFGEAMDGQIELAWSEATEKDVNGGSLFDTVDIDTIVDRAAALNEMEGRNTYIGMAARSPNAAPFARTKDGDYFATHAVAVDLDAPGSVEAAKAIYDALNLRPSWAVVTGEHPHRRAQLWWKLDAPMKNPSVHREIQSGLAAKFNGDPTIINPGRIMRLAGSIAWPKKPGRIPEMTAFYPVSGAEYPVDRLLAVAKEALAAKSAQSPSQPKSSGLGLDTGHVGADIDALLREAHQPGLWHHSVLRLTASLVGKGLPDSAIYAMAPALTMAGYTVAQTEDDMRVMIDGARAQGFTPQIAAPQPTADEAREQAAETPDDEIGALFPAWEVIDPRTIPRIEFVYSDFYAKGYTSLTVAAPKVGKSLLGIAEAFDIATGLGIFTGYRSEPQNVVYYNAEDDQALLNNRVIGLCLKYGVSQHDIAGRLRPVSGVSRDDFFFISGDRDVVINEPLFAKMERFCELHKAAAMIFDPLQDLSRSPETNDVFRLMGQRLRLFADRTGAALGIVHHTRKLTPGMTPTIDDARGGGALRGTARFNRLLYGMTEEEAAKAGVPDHRAFFRIADVESNLAPPSSDRNRWFQKISVDTPNGQSAGVVSVWEWPDAFAGITAADARRVRAAVDASNPPPRMNPQASQWIGYLVADVLEIDVTDKANKERVKGMIRGWIAEDVLREAVERSPRDGRDVPICICGANAALGD